jgi:hypothetical protein
VEASHNPLITNYFASPRNELGLLQKVLGFENESKKHVKGHKH